MSYSGNGFIRFGVNGLPRRNTLQRIMTAEHGESFETGGRLARAFDAVSQEPYPAARAAGFILLFGLTSLATQVVCWRLMELLGRVSFATLNTLFLPSIVTAAAALLFAVWHWRSLRWWWIAGAAVPWLTTAATICRELFVRFV